MTKQEWLARAREHAEVLKWLVGNYHPSAGWQPRHELEITAPAAEDACELVRSRIAVQEPQDPLKRLDAALTIGDVAEIVSVLNGAWFGVPESTGCWLITGFKEAVDLLDDPPEQDV